MRIGLFVSGTADGTPMGVTDAVEQVKAAERDGFATAWFPQLFELDAIMACALAGQQTERIELGTAVVPTYPRHPTAIAMQALTAQSATGNRFALGIGLSHQLVIEGMLGMSYKKSYSHMKEYVSVLRPLLHEGSASHEGDFFRVTATAKVGGAEPCPLLLAALAPKMLALAGGVADGTITWMTGPRTIEEYTLPTIREAAQKAGRPAPRVVVGLPVSITDKRDGALESAAHVFQMYGSLPSYRAMLDREGAKGPADVAIVGDESYVAGQIDRLQEMGVTDFLSVPFPVRADPEASARTREYLATRARA